MKEKKSWNYITELIFPNGLFWVLWTGGDDMFLKFNLSSPGFSLEVNYKVWLSSFSWHVLCCYAQMSDLKIIQCSCAIASQSNDPKSDVPAQRIENPDTDTGTITLKKLPHDHSIDYTSIIQW